MKPSSSEIQRLFAVGFIFFLITVAVPVRAQEKSVGVLFSREIAPYISMVEGLEASLSFPVQRYFFDKDGVPYSLSGQNPKLTRRSHNVWVAVGPEALRYLHSTVDRKFLVFGMVLNPDRVFAGTDRPCGISLNIPAEAQFSSISQYLPSLKRLGVLFDPVNNQTWFDDAVVSAQKKDLDLIPLQVTRKAGKMTIVGDFTQLDAILFIPDKSIISKAVIQYVIKQGVLHATPVIGYNKFFYHSGAAINFLIDYQKVGQQVAAHVKRLLSGEQCTDIYAPIFDVLINEDVWRSLHLPARSGISPSEGTGVDAVQSQ